MSDEIFGQGIRYPVRSSNGRLRMSEGERRVMESVEVILNTPKGACPMDPRFGVSLDAYDPVSSGEVLAWEIADAIEYGEPRAEEIDVSLESYDPLNGRLSVRIEIMPVNSQTRLNRVFPVYRSV